MVPGAMLEPIVSRFGLIEVGWLGLSSGWCSPVLDMEDASVFISLNQSDPISSIETII